tara:strand:+ start:225919 stop:227445 length:1527 start_codon:yes stop_codon:yes gene_type:complete
MASLATIWGIIEPLWAVIQLALHIGSKNYLKVPKEQINPIVSEAFDDFTRYLQEFGLEKKLFAPQDKSIYISAIIARLDYTNESYQYIDGQIEYYLSQRFNIPNENRFDKFILNSYLLIRVKNYRKYSFPAERFNAIIFKKRKTIFHYLSVSNWRRKNYKVLQKEVQDIKKPIAIWIEEFKFADLWEYAQKNEDSSLKLVLDNVLKSGQISQTAILNMAATERLLIIYKYSEGFSSVRELQLTKLKKLNDAIKQYSGKNSSYSKNKLQIAKSEKQSLIDNWVRVPIGSVLEEKGFKHLFSKRDPIYFIPISILPTAYHKEPKKYLDEVVIPEAEALLDSLRDNEYMVEFSGGLKYLMVSHIVQVNELSILESERSLSSLAPTINQSLLTTTLDNEGSYINSLFINDVVRNVDFLQFLKPGKTTDYLKANFDNLKALLFNKYTIDLYKPIQLSSLTENQIEEIASNLIAIDGNVKKHFLIKSLSERVEFYRNLDTELRQLKMKNEKHKN